MLYDVYFNLTLFLEVARACMSAKPTVELFLDFDGTIINQDTAEIVLDRFGDPDWILIDDAHEKGEISLEESIAREFATLKVPEQEIIKEVSRVAQFRPNFDALVEFCKGRHLSVKVVSGGLDFLIRHFLGRDEWLNFIEIHCPKTQFTKEGYSLTFPPRFDPRSKNFKDDLVKQERKNGIRVFFVGDGIGDLSAAKESDFVFAVKESRLAELCREQNVSFQEIDDFSQVIAALNQRVPGM